jgi:MFS family permease
MAAPRSTLPVGAPPEQAVRQAALVVLVGVSCALHVGKLPVAIPVLGRELGVTLLQAGFLLSLIQLAGMTLGLMVGLRADRVGPRRVMLAGLVSLAVGSGLGALSGSVGMLLFSRLVEGLGFLLAVLPAPGLLRQRVAHAPTLARALGWWGAYMPVGTALALLLGAPLIGQVGWRWAWAGLAAVSLLAAEALRRGIASESPLTSAGAGGPPSMWPRLARTLRAPGPWLLATGFFLYSGQWLARGARPGVLLAVAYAAMGAGALVAFGAQGQPVLQYAAVLVFSGVGGLVPGTLFGLAVVLAPGQDTVSTTVGWMQQFSSLGQFVGPPVVAWVALLAGGWQLTWVVTGACSLLGLWVALRLQAAWRDRPRAL